MTPRPLRFALLAVLCAAPATAQRAPVTLSVDYATFMYEDEATLLEVYLGVGARSLRFVPDGAGSFATTVPIQLALVPTAVAAPEGAASDVVWSRDADLRLVVQDTAALQMGQFFLQRVRAAVPPGEYTLQVRIPADAPSGRAATGLDVDGVRVPDFSEDDRAGISGITLASAIRPGADRNDPFFTNGLSVLPNPNAVYGPGQPLQYYTEVYGVPETLGSGPYTLLAYVAAADEPRPLPGYQQRLSRPAADPDVLVGSFDVSGLPSGRYYLRLAALTPSNEPVVEQSKVFFVLNPDVAATDAMAGGELDFEARYYAVVPAEELGQELDQIGAIASQPELRQMRALVSDDARRAFLAAFWRNHDTDTDPNRNAAREQFQQRLREIERFGVGGLTPWESDRGRVVLRYGLPAEIERNPQNQNLVAHEIWRYDNIPNQGQAVFVFADREITSRYELIHSTVIGEVSAPNWEQMLQQ